MEFMTALHSTFDDHKPSLFELLSEAQLASLLPPSLSPPSPSPPERLPPPSAGAAAGMLGQ